MRGGGMNADDILNCSVKNSRGQLVPFSGFIHRDAAQGARLLRITTVNIRNDNDITPC
jgi:hypothetical protein